MKNICIIPARGGSKRIPRKNIKYFLGKPVLAFAIEIALKSELFDEIMVSTDDVEIAEIAIKYGAKVPFLRSEQTSNDFATTAEVLIEVLRNYSELNMNFDNLCCLYPCTPLLEAEHLDLAYQKLNNKNLESVFPVLKFSVPIQRALQINEDLLSWQFPANALKRTQDLSNSYHDAGQFYFLKTKQFLESKKILTEFTGTIILDEMEVQDIDNEIDWQLAELKFRLKNNL